MSIIRVCIGTEKKTSIPCKVLEHSILKHSSQPVEFHHMMGESWAKRTTTQGTGFSLQRWYIPEYFNFKGKAIYLDVDMLCFTDIAEFWNIDETFEETSSIYCTFQRDKFYENAPATSSMLINCELAKDDWHLMLMLNRLVYIELIIFV
jgi:lipopolysaccharide biosynthesis glycosyltransferase